MKAAVIFILLLCGCIGSGTDESRTCEKPTITLHAQECGLADGETGILFNGVHYYEAGACEESTAALTRVSLPDAPWEVYTEGESRNPDNIIIKKDDTFHVFKKHNQGKVIFIEMIKRREATQISGRGKVGGHEGGFMTYFFDAERKLLQGKIAFPLDETVILVCGFQLERTGDGEVGGTSHVYGVSDFPATVSDAEVLAVEEDGTVHLFLYCCYLTIAPGESQEIEHSFQDKAYNVTYMVVVTYTIANYGFLNLDNIVAE